MKLSEYIISQISKQVYLLGQEPSKQVYLLGHNCCTFWGRPILQQSVYKSLTKAFSPNYYID